MNTLKSGDLAYVDGFNGMRPCKVLSIREGTLNGTPLVGVEVRMTTATPGYARGEVVTFTPSMVVPRTCVNRRRQTIMPYVVIDDVAFVS